ncbi:MAG: Na+/H+ antiporter subunit E [Halobacteriales archaeon]|nr:Na+/H+ antiporter subunit E [Halobacteriales archaeon]
MTRTWPVAGGLLAGLWLFVRGVTLAPAAIIGELLIGLAFGLPVAYASRNFYEERIDLGRTLRAVPYGLIYLVVFVRDLIVANFDVAYRIIWPWATIEPAVVVFPLRVQTDIGITTIANSITLTPGTLTMDYDAETNALLIHTIDGRDREAVVEPIRQWEEYALVIFDEEQQPGDPIPGRPSDDALGGDHDDG